MSTARTRQITAVIESIGGRVSSITVNGNGHYKVRFSARGLQYSTVFARTPSDWRADLNKRAELRRALRDAAAARRVVNMLMLSLFGERTT